MSGPEEPFLNEKTGPPAESGHAEQSNDKNLPDLNPQKVDVYICCLCCCPKADEGTGPKEDSHFPERRPWRDWFFALLWLLGFCATIGSLAWVIQDNGIGQVVDNFYRLYPNISEEARGNSYSISLFCVGTTIFCIAWTLALLTFALDCMVRFSLLFSISAMLMLGGYLFYVGNILGGCVYVLIAIAAAFVLFYFRDSLPFSVAMIRTSMKVVWRMYGVLIYALLSVLVQAAWIWVIGALTVHVAADYDFEFCDEEEAKASREAGDDSRCAMPRMMIPWLTLLFFSYVWTAQLLMYMLHFVAASNAAQYLFYHCEDLDERKKLIGGRCFRRYPTLCAFRYSMTNNLGTVALAALMIALVKTIRFIIRIICRHHECVNCIVQCLFSCIEGALDYLNHYVIAYAAIFGFGFQQAAKNFDKLIKDAGLLAVYGDEVSGLIVFGNTLLTAAVVGTSTFLYAKFTYGVTSMAYVGSFSALFAFFATQNALAIVSSSVSALLICIAYTIDVEQKKGTGAKAKMGRQQAPQLQGLMGELKDLTDQQKEKKLKWVPWCFII